MLQEAKGLEIPKAATLMVKWVSEGLSEVTVTPKGRIETVPETVQAAAERTGQRVAEREKIAGGMEAFGLPPSRK